MRKLDGLIVGLGVAGWLISYGFFVVYLAEHHGDFWGGWVAAFTANDWAVGLIWDLVLTSWMLIVLAIRDRRRLGGRWVAAVLAGLMLSVSIAFALYLLGMWRAEGADGSKITR